MKILITESQYRIIKEETSGINDFISKIIETYPKVEEYSHFIKKFIEESDCKKIEVAENPFMAMGLALHDKVVFNPNLFKHDLGFFLYVIFHEMAHQYQYKKYGEKYIYKLYTGELDMNSAVRLLKYIENVADQFSLRKCRELLKKGLNFRIVKTGSYDNIPDVELKKQLVKIRNLIRNKNISDPQKISETYYNYILNINNDIKT